MTESRFDPISDCTVANKQGHPVEPGETSLLLYSVLMATSAFVLGGFNVWSVAGTREQDPTGSASNLDTILAKSRWLLYNGQGIVKTSMTSLLNVSPETMVWLSSMLCLVVLLAFATNPSDTSFRSYLTDNVLRRHMQAFRQDVYDAAHSSGEESDEIHELAKHEASRAAFPSHYFTNRITISLRTPAYDKNDYGLFSTTTVQEEKVRGLAERSLHVGLFGKWWRVNSWEVRRSSQSLDWGISKVTDIEFEEDDSHDALKANRSQADVAESSANLSSSDKASARRKKAAIAGKQRAESQSPSIKSKDASTSYDSKFGDVGTPKSSVAQSASSEQHTFDVNTTNGSVGHGGSANEHTESVAEGVAQLEQIRTGSEAARKTLQTQLEELRARKRDEDATRLDVKGRMKALDEHKRQAEATKREAERRLKQANLMRDNFANRLTSKTQEMSSLRKREAAHQQKVQSSASEKEAMLQELSQRLGEEKQKEIAAEVELSEVKQRLEHLQERVLEEEGNLEAAREMATEQYAFGGDQSFGSRGQHDAHIYPHTQGVSSFELANQYGNNSDADQGTARGPGDSAIYSHNNTTTSPGQRWPTAFTDGPIAPQPRSLALVASMMDEGMPETHAGRILDESAFDPTLTESDAELMSRNRFSPFSFDQNNVIFNGGIDQGLAQSRVSSVTPLSPFQSDLLPSNLFQNADEDERHVGILPGTHSDRVEAALNRFGLDSSDVSDVDSNRGDVEAASETGQSVDKASTASSTKGSWWNGRRRSKERDGQSKLLNSEGDIRPLTEDQGVSSGGGEEKDSNGGTVNKRRSMSIFPKLTLNPGAKSFRGSMKRSNQQQQQQKENEEESQSSDVQTPSAVGPTDPMLRRAWNSSLGNLPSSQRDYELLKRAFEADGALSRASFDVQTRSPEQRWRANVNRAWPSHLRADGAEGQNHAAAAAAAAAPRSSSDSVRNAFAGYSNTASASTDWLDDIIMPLQPRASSEAVSQRGDAAPSSSTPPSRFSFLSSNSNSSRPSRFALWRSASRDGTDVSQQAKAASAASAEESNEKSDAESASLASKTSQQTGDDGSAVSSSNLVSPSNPKSKRSSFLWPSRKADNASGATDTTETEVEDQIT